MLKNAVLFFAILILGFYSSIKFTSWFGEDISMRVQSVFIFVEDAVLGAFKLAYVWVASLFKES